MSHKHLKQQVLRLWVVHSVLALQPLHRRRRVPMKCRSSHQSVNSCTSASGNGPQQDLVVSVCGCIKTSCYAKWVHVFLGTGF